MNIESEIIQNNAVCILRDELHETVFKDYYLSLFYDFINGEIENIDNQITVSFLTELVKNVNSDDVSSFLDGLLEDEVEKYINLVIDENQTNYSGIPEIPECAKKILENTLLTEIINNNFEQLSNSYLEDFYIDIEIRYPWPLTDLVKRAIDHIDYDQIKEMTKEIIKEDVQNYINDF